MMLAQHKTTLDQRLTFGRYFSPLRNLFENCHVAISGYRGLMHHGSQVRLSADEKNKSKRAN